LPKNLIIIPTYNEIENIEELITRIFQIVPQVHLLVVDDGSKDGTAAKVKELMTRYPDKVNILERPGKMGLGSAYIAGFKWGLASGFDTLTEMDADFSHNPEVLPNLLDKLKDHPVVVGSRYVPGGSTRNWSILRKMISRFGSFYARTILGIKVSDLTGGFNGWQAKVLKAIDPDTITSEGYSFQIELKYRAHLCGFSILEIPIIFFDRFAGQSKMSTRIVIEAMFRVWMLRFNAGFYKRLYRESTVTAEN